MKLQNNKIKWKIRWIYILKNKKQSKKLNSKLTKSIKTSFYHFSRKKKVAKSYKKNIKTVTFLYNNSERKINIVILYKQK